MQGRGGASRLLKKGLEETMRALRSDSVPGTKVQIERPERAGDLCRAGKTAQAGLDAPHECCRTLADSNHAGLPQQSFDTRAWSAAGQKQLGAQSQQLRVPEGLPGLTG